MAYHLYRTEGFVLGERAHGEANKIYYVLTPDFGLIAVMAQGIRNIRSKLKFHLDRFSHIKLVVVRGREIWRLTNAEKINALEKIYSDRAKLKQLAKIFSVLSHLIRGEERSEELFSELKNSLAVLDRLVPGINELNNWERIALLRLLKHLGYLKEEAVLAEYIEPHEWGSSLVEKMTSKERSMATRLINLSLEHSHF